MTLTKKTFVNTVYYDRIAFSPVRALHTF